MEADILLQAGRRKISPLSLLVEELWGKYELGK